jgi:alpha-aminoadipate carrier protein LysW
MKVSCPECAAEFEAPNDVVVGEIISCPDCGLEIEVSEINGDKVILKSAEVEGEDWGE